MALSPDRSLDCVGLFCPMPVLRTRETMRAMAPGQVLEVTADDPASEEDFRRWAARMGHDLLEIDKRGGIFRFILRKSR